MTNTNKQTASHTPGEWVQHRDNDAMVISIRSKDGFPIATVELSDKEINGYDRLEEDEANAQLIAAAPELLEALTDIRIAYNGVLNELAGEDSNYCDNAKYSSLLQKVDRAIAKVEGRA